MSGRRIVARACFRASDGLDWLAERLGRLAVALWRFGRDAEEGAR